MLGMEKKKSIEESVLASFITYPSIGYKLINKLQRKHFSSTSRANLFTHILNEKKDKRQILLSELDGKLLIEGKIVFGKDHLHNLKSYIEQLIEEGYIDDMYKLGQELMNMSVEDKSLKDIVKKTKRVLLNVNLEQDTDHFISMEDAINNIETGVINHKEYKIDIPTMDKFMPVTTQGITVIAGNEGSFKTKLMIFIMRKLLKNYDNISVLWYSMEDPSDKIIRAFISQDEFLSDKELKRVEYSKLIPKDVSKFDIQFVTKSQTIKEIGDEYERFRESREDRFNILIVDNLMKVIPIDTRVDPDLEIIREVESWNVKTSNKETSVYLLHHFTKAPADDKNKEHAYQPKIGHIRGSGRYKDAATNVILANPMYSYSDIIELFEGYEEFISKFYTLTIAKNRNDKKAKIRMVAYPAYNHFIEI